MAIVEDHLNAIQENVDSFHDLEVETVVAPVVPHVDPKELEEAFNAPSLEPQTKTLTLADALREASRLGIKQTTGTYVKDDNTACALGAAYIVAKRRGLI